MVRAGLGDAWTCMFANDLDERKAIAYERNWGFGQLLNKDIANVLPNEVPGCANLAWASFPCQDLSLAGMGAGLKGDRSGAFWPFWNLIRRLNSEGRKPDTVVLENVCGALTSHGGADFTSLIKCVRSEGYRVGAMVIDAALFVPQSRPRLFIIGVRQHIDIDPDILADGPEPAFHSAALVTAYEQLSNQDRESWVWWNPPLPPRRTETFANLVENHIAWHEPAVTKSLLAMMSPINLAKIAAAQKMGTKVVGTIYKRTRPNELGHKKQRAEVRFDDVAGCLRTPGGGSSRQMIILVHRDEIRTRLLSAREAARLMGLPDSYVLPTNYNEAYGLMGDGVAVPVVSHLARYILEPLIKSAKLGIERAA